MASVFINYRGSDQPWVANWLCTELAGRIGSNEVFLDTRSIVPGADFTHQLLAEVRSCTVLVVLVGPDWYAHGPNGRLIDDHDDWVRKEIVAAFDARIRVLPILVGDVPRLDADDLPVDIQRLARLQYLRVRVEDACRDIPRAVRAILPTRVGVPLPEATSRDEVDRLLRDILPPAQQRFGDRRRLADVAHALLLPDERPRFVAPCRFSGRYPGSAVLLVTDRRLSIADLGHGSHVRPVLRFALGQILGTEVHRGWRAGVVPVADLVVTTHGGSRILVRSLFRAQAERAVEYLAPGGHGEPG